jgi:hypothetical protein
MRRKQQFLPHVLFGLALLSAGCANREGTTEDRSSEHEPAPPELTGSQPVAKPPVNETAPGLAGPASRTAPNPKPPSSPVVRETKTPPSAEAEQAALDAYTAKMLPILQAGGAERNFHEEMSKAGPQIEAKGINALIPIYGRYASAVQTSAARLPSVTPPPEAAGVHRAWIAYFTSIAKNLADTVSAMKANDGTKASVLAHEREPLIAREHAELKKAVSAGGFDASYFERTGRLVPAGSKEAQTAPIK